MKSHCIIFSWLGSQDSFCIKLHAGECSFQGICLGNTCTGAGISTDVWTIPIFLFFPCKPNKCASTNLPSAFPNLHQSTSMFIFGLICLWCFDSDGLEGIISFGYFNRLLLAPFKKNYIGKWTNFDYTLIRSKNIGSGAGLISNLYRPGQFVQHRFCVNSAILFCFKLTAPEVLNTGFLPPISFVTVVLSTTTVALRKIGVKFHFLRCLGALILRKCVEDVDWVLGGYVVLCMVAGFFFGGRSLCCWRGLGKEGLSVPQQILVALEVVEERFSFRSRHFVTICWLPVLSQTAELVMLFMTINLGRVVFQFMYGWKLLLIGYWIPADTLVFNLTAKLGWWVAAGQS